MTLVMARFTRLHGPFEVQVPHALSFLQCSHLVLSDLYMVVSSSFLLIFINLILCL